MDVAVQQCVDYLNEAINNRHKGVNSPKFEQLLGYVAQMLGSTESKLVIQAQPQGSYCLHCDRYIRKVDKSKGVGLWCNPNEHFFCTPACFQKHALAVTNNTLFDLENVSCPYCKVPVPFEQINELFEGRIEEIQNDACNRALNNLLDEEAKDGLRAKFTCPVCFQDLKVEEGMTLECEHRFCFDCAKQYVENLIEEAQVSDSSLKCPNCPYALSVYEIEGLVQEDLFEKYMKFRLRGFRVDDDSERVFQCLGTDCEYFCILDKNLDEFACPLCNFKCCPQCKEEVHKDFTCEQYQTWKKENGQADKKFDELLDQQGFLKCPDCGTAIEKVDGCQYITCVSSQCQGRTYLCYDCGLKLKHDHGAHKCNPRARPVNVPAPAVRPGRRRRERPAPAHREPFFQRWLPFGRNRRK